MVPLINVSNVAPEDQQRLVDVLVDATQTERSEERRRARLPQWPRALRGVREWLEPYIMVWRYWRAFTDKDQSDELRALL